MEEQKERYFDAKEEFKEYMQDTFPLRLNFVIEEECDDAFLVYEKCLEIKEQHWGFFRYSQIRAGLGQIYFCMEKQAAYSKCLDAVNREQQEQKLRDNDQKTFTRLFPR